MRLVGVEQVRRELRAERQEQAADRPRRHHAQRGEQEGPAHRGRDARPLRGQPQAACARRPARASSRAPAKAIAKSTNSADVRQHARRGHELDERGGDEHAEARAAGARDAVGQPDARRVAARVQIEQRGAGGAERGAGRQPLHAAGDEEPDDRVGEHEEHGGRHERAERGEQDRPAADLVGHAPGEQQRGEHAERVRRVDERQVSGEKPQSSR